MSEHEQSEYKVLHPPGGNPPDGFNNKKPIHDQEPGKNNPFDPDQKTIMCD